MLCLLGRFSLAFISRLMALVVFLACTYPSTSFTSFTKSVALDCQSFVNRCLLSPGAPPAASLVHRSAATSLYFYINRDSDEDVFISIPVVFGYVSLYAKSQAEPKYEPFSKPINSFAGITKIDKRICPTSKSCNLLIRVLSESFFAVQVYSHSVAPTLIPGLPIPIIIEEPRLNIIYSSGTIANHSSIKFIVTSLSSSLIDHLYIEVMSTSSPGISQHLARNSSHISMTIAGPLAKHTSTAVTLIVRQTVPKIFCNSLVSMTPFSSTTALRLLNGFPSFGASGVAELNFYRVAAPKVTAGSSLVVDIFLDNTIGDADLFVNPRSTGFYTHLPGERMSAFSSLRSDGHDSLSILLGSLPECVITDSIASSSELYCELLITVIGITSSEYFIRSVISNSPYVVIEGMQHRNFVTSKGYRYFAFIDSDTSRTLNFDLNPSSGDADIFVSCFNSFTGTDSGLPSRLAGHSNASSQDYLEDAIAIEPLDKGRSCKPGKKYFLGNSVTYYIAIYGFSQSEFILISRWAGESTQTLLPGVPIQGSVFRGLDSHYILELGAVPKELRILLTPLSDGDPDIFLTLKGKGLINPKQSSYLSFEYRSSKTGRDVDEIVVSEGSICVSCAANIVVHGYSSAQYSIIAMLSDTTVALALGTPQRGVARVNVGQYYTFRASVSGRYTVQLTVLAGQPVLLASLMNEEPSLTDKIGTLRSNGNHLIYVDVDVGNYTGKDVYLGVLSTMGQNTTYTIRASAFLLHSEDSKLAIDSMLHKLIPGTPQFEVIDNSLTNPNPTLLRGWLGWQYYSILLPAGNEDLLLRATALAGNINLYINKCPTTECLDPVSLEQFLPNQTHFLASTQGDAYDNMRIRRSDKISTRYLIGVQISSDSQYAVFSISYNLDKNLPLSIQDGVPVLDHVDQGEIDYYTFVVKNFEKDSKLHIILTPMLGDPDLFVSTVNTHPGPHNYSWKSIEYGSDFLDISTSSSEGSVANLVDDDSLSADGFDGGVGCTGCVYYIAVVGIRESTYTLSVTLSSSLPRLVEAVPTSGRVAMGQWAYYLFSFNYIAANDLRLTLNTKYGNSDLYANVAIETFAARYLSTTFSLEHSNFVDASIDSVDKPSLLHFGYRSTSLGIKIDEISILHSDQIIKTCQTLHATCLLTIGVYGVEDSEFSLIAARESSAMLVQQGVPVVGVVPSADEGPDHRRYYRVIISGVRISDSTNSSNVGKAPAPIQFTFALYSGELIVCMSCKQNRPNVTNSDFHYFVESIVSGSSSSSLQHNSTFSFSLPSISLLDAGCTQGSQLFISVENRTKWQSQFAMTVVEASQQMVYLEADFTLFSSVVFRKFEYYYVRPGTTYQDILLSLTPLSGDIDVFVSRSWDTRPRLDKNDKPSSYLIGSASLGSESLLLDHDWIQSQCEHRQQCYIVVAVMGAFSAGSSSSSEGGSRYMITASKKDSIRLLVNGLPVRGHVFATRYEYYRYPISQLDKDIITSVSVITGDVDLFVALDSPVHPTRLNYSWASAFAGSDVVTIQIEDISRKCRERLLSAGTCFLYIGVYGFTNSSYSIVTTPDAGFASPILLAEHDTQQRTIKFGHYTYFSFLVPPIATSSVLTSSIRFSLTCVSGDADLFATLSTSDKGEPGRFVYDYKSQNWGGVVDEIVVSAGNGAGLFCINCVIYIAVYGYSDASYVLSASISGVESLISGISTGGHVELEGMRYYSFKNLEQTAKLTILLNSIQGDADLYITTSEDKQQNYGGLPLPSLNHFSWRSLRLGEDSVRISYNDQKFCFDCFYIIGVYGYQNCTYSLLITESDSTAIRLSTARPTLFHISAKQLRYFIAVPRNDIDDMLLSLTTMDSGHVNMYVHLHNITLNKIDKDDDSFNSDGRRSFPDPAIPSSYDLSTTISRQDSIVLQPYAANNNRVSGGSPLVYLITLQAGLGDVTGTLLVSSSSRHILLSTGTPQNHFVEAGHTAFFAYYPSSDPVDTLGSSNIRVSVVPTSGDPDLLISANPMNEKPQCMSSTTVPDSLSVLCSNYTWMSRMYNSDQIIINGDYPCETVLSSTSTSASCLSDISQGLARQNAPLYIGVFGFRSSAFTITVSRGLSHEILVAGQPHPSLLSVGYLCELRSPKTGICMDSPLNQIERAATQIDVAYFTFKITTQEKNTPLGAVIFMVTPRCNASSYQSSICLPGCECNPLQVFVRSCILPNCNSQTAMPGPHDRFDVASMTVNNMQGNSLFIEPTSPAYCDSLGQIYECIYFVAVMSTTFTGMPSAFTITARTPGDIILVPCKHSPDGIIYQQVEELGRGTQNSKSNVLLEVCTNKYTLDSKPVSAISTTRIMVERCVGPSKVALYACGPDDGCIEGVPSSRSWKYYSDGIRNCINYDTINGQGTINCQNGYGFPDVSIPSNLPSTTSLNPSSGLFINLEGEPGRYLVRVFAEIGGQPLPVPLLLRSQKSKMKEDSIKVSVTGTGAELEWNMLEVSFPINSDSESNLNSDANRARFVSSDIRYSLLVAPTAEIEDIVSSSLISLSSACGVEYLMSILSSDSKKRGVFLTSVYMLAQEESSAVFKRKVSGLLPHSAYSVFLLASCDSACLQIIGKTHLGVNFCGDLGDECKSMQVLFHSASFFTGTKANDLVDNGDDKSPSNSITESNKLSVLGALIVGTVVIVVIFMLIKYFKFGGVSFESGLDHMYSGVRQSEMVDFSSSTHGSNYNSVPNDHNNGNSGNVITNMWSFIKDKVSGASTTQLSLHQSSTNNSWAKSSTDHPFHSGQNNSINQLR